MAYDKRFKRFQEFVEGAEDWKETRCDKCKGLPDTGCTSCGDKGWYWKNTRTGAKELGYGNPVRFKRVDEDKTCRACDGKGWVWSHPEPGEDVILDTIECPRCHGEGTLKEDAPAMAAGNGGIAGLGVPAGSKFGEHPQQAFALGGATTKTRKKNKRPVDEAFPAFGPFVAQHYADIARERVARETIRQRVARDQEQSRKKESCDYCDDRGWRRVKHYDTTLWDVCDACGNPKHKPKPSSVNEGNASDVIPKFTGDRPKKLPSEHHYDSMLGWVERDKERIAKLTALLSVEKDPLTLAPVKSALAHAKQELATHERELDKIGKEIERYRADKAAGIKRDGKSPTYEGFGDWVTGKSMSDRDTKAVIANAKAALAVYPDDLIPKLKRLLADVGTGQPNPSAVVRLRQFLRDNGMVYEWDQAPDPIEGGEKITEDRETFAGAPVFEVDTDKWMKSRFGKNRYHRYSKYVGEDEQGEEIRQHGRSQRKSDIILKDQATGAMTWFLRRKKASQ